MKLIFVVVDEHGAFDSWFDNAVDANDEAARLTAEGAPHHVKPMIELDTSQESALGWIGVDLDGTLAVYDGWRGEDHIGEPIQPMVDLVIEWVAAGVDVRIFTARAATNDIKPINDWCQEHIGKVLPVTCVKDYGMVELWDDRCVQVIPNTGRRADGKERV